MTEVNENPRHIVSVINSHKYDLAGPSKMALEIKGPGHSSLMTRTQSQNALKKKKVCADAHLYNPSIPFDKTKSRDKRISWKLAGQLTLSMQHAAQSGKKRKDLPQK